MKLPEPLKYDSNISKPENVNFFIVVSNKLNNETVKSICFNDVLFCEKTEIIDNSYYVLIKKNVNKLGFIKNIETNGDFLLESTHHNKNLFPDYKHNINDFSEIYRVLNLSRNIENLKENYSEDWNDYNEVIDWIPKDYEDLLSYNYVLKKYNEKNFK